MSPPESGTFETFADETLAVLLFSAILGSCSISHSIPDLSILIAGITHLTDIILTQVRTYNVLVSL